MNESELIQLRDSLRDEVYRLEVRGATRETSRQYLANPTAMMESIRARVQEFMPQIDEGASETSRIADAVHDVKGLHLARLKDWTALLERWAKMLVGR